MEILNSFGELIEHNVWLGPFIALIAGVLTSFMPCCLSTVPLVISYVGSDNKSPFRLSLVLALGSASVFLVLGILASIFGDLIGHTHVFDVILALLLITMVLQLWDVINIFPHKHFSKKDKKKGYGGAYLIGMLTGLFSSTCSAPVLMVMLAIAASKGSILYGIILLLLYSIGHSLILVIAGTSASFVKKLMKNPKYDKIMNVVKIIFGIIILLLAIYLLFGEHGH